MADILGANSLIPFGRVSGGGGGGGIDLLKVNRDSTKEARFERSSNTVIPAGWYYLSIYNASIQGPINVNGKDVHAQGNWNGSNQIDWAAGKQEFGPEVTIISNGEPFSFHVCYPTSSSVDVNTI